MSDTPTRYPLAWPIGRPRAKSRKPGRFGAAGDRGYKVEISIARAMDRLEEEVQRLGGVNTLLSSNLDTRLDGRPRSGQSEPSDPGVCLYFTMKGKPMALACDAYTKVAQNIAALAAHLEATRAIERHGVATAAETLQAFQALPAPDHVLPARKPWRQVLGFADSWPHNGTPLDQARDTVSRHYRAEAIKAAGDEAALSDLNVARDAALKELT
jgi:hypothetical protein